MSRPADFKDWKTVWATLDGLLTFTAPQALAGQTLALRIVVTDVLHGLSATQRFRVTVIEPATQQPGGPPVHTAGPQIHSEPESVAYVDETYTYTLQATDSDTPDEDLVYTLIDGPSWLTQVTPGGKVFVGTPTSASSPVVVEVEVSDPQGNAIRQRWQLQVVEASQPVVNHAPRIVSIPGQLVTAGQVYTYQAIAEDDEGDALTWSIDPVAGLPDLAITAGGKVTFTAPASLAGQVVALRVAVTDATHDLSAWQEIPIRIVAANAPPIIVTQELPQGTAGQDYQAQVIAYDPNGDLVTYRLEVDPSLADAITIDSAGRLRWRIPADHADEPVALTVIVQDRFGATTQRQYALQVQADAQDPTVQVTGNYVQAAIGTAVNFVVHATDNIGISRLQAVLVNHDTQEETILAVGAGGQVTHAFSTAGSYTLIGTAWDAAGNQTDQSFSLTIYDPATQAAPQITVAGPAEGSTISAGVDVVATITDADGIAWYRVELIGENAAEPLILAQGTGEVDGQAIATINPMALTNGAYTLRVVASDGQLTSTHQRAVWIESELKLGNYNISFNDLSVTLGGLPINIVRNYDTLQANEQGDFGFGWNLSLFDAHIESDLAGTYSSFQEMGLDALGYQPALRNGTRLSVTGADGKTNYFTVTVRPVSDSPYAGFLGLANLYRVDFIADDPNTSLTVTQPNATVSVNEYGELESSGLPYSPGNLGYNYFYTTADGLKYELDGRTGELISIQDRQSNRLVVASDGISSVAPDGTVIAKVTFERDSQGRITRMIDPAGAAIEYTYDSAGDLVAVTDRVGATTTYEYAAPSNQPHYLTDIIDARGINVLHTQFDSQGRLISLSDASGADAPFTYNLALTGGRYVQRVADTDGISTEMVHNAAGDAVLQVQLIQDHEDPAQRQYLVTAYTYDSNHQQTGISDAYLVVGDDNRFDTPPAAWASTSTVDANGNVLSTTDALGNTTHYAYNPWGQLTTTIDALGNVTRNNYSDKGQLTSTVDALGNVTTYTYDNSGNLTALTNSAGQVVATFTYNNKGLLTSSTDANGVARHFAYDAAGNQTESWHDEGNIRTLSRTTYDAAGRVTATAQAVIDLTTLAETLLFSSSTTYTATGQVATSTDQHGLVTQNTYDSRGLLIQTRTQASDGDTTIWLVSRTVYDANGRAIWNTDTFPEAQAATGISATRTYYDNQGRVIATEQRAGVIITIEEDTAITSATVFTTSLSDDGDLLTRSETVYDHQGRVIQSRSQSIDEEDNIVWLTSETLYDAAGRVFVSTDTHLENALAADITGSRNVYDALGRVIESQQLENVQITIAGAVPTLAEEGNIVATSRTVYDALGRVTESYAPSAEHDGSHVLTLYTYNNLGQQTHVTVDLDGDASTTNDQTTTETQYDPVTGQRTKVIDANGHETSFTYDSFGRVVLTTYHDSTTTSSTYDAQGRLASETDQLGRTKRYEYDTQGRLTAVILPAVVNPANPGQMLHPRYEYTYDALGRQTAITVNVAMDASGNVIHDHDGITGDDRHTTIFTYDHLGRQLNRTLPDGQVETNVYVDVPGVPGGSRLSHTIDFEGRVTYYVYEDALTPAFGRLEAQYFFTDEAAFNAWQLDPVNELPGQIVSYTYDVFGNQTSVLQDFDGNLSTTTDQRESAYTYDLQGRLIAAANSEGTIHHEYAAITGLLTRTWSSLPGQSSVHTDTQYTYDALGRLSTITVTTQHGQSLGSADVTLYAYDALGNLSLVTLPNGIRTQYVYDNLNRLVEMIQFEDHASNGTSGMYDGGVDTLIASYEYTLDDAGNRIGAIETNDLGQVTTIDWQYDALNRLVYESYDSFDDTVDYTHTYVYDLTGNRTVQYVWDEADADVQTPATADEYTTYEYDASDRLIEEIYYEGVTAKTETTYSYTATEQTEKEVVDLATSKTTTRTTMSYDLQGRLAQIVIEQLDANEDVTRRETQQYIYNAPGSAYASGIRVQETSTVEVWNAGTQAFDVEVTVTTSLIDAGNPTGYAQTLVQRMYDGNGVLIKEHNFTLGHDVHGQSTFDAVAETITAYYLLTDGHGSVRQLTDALANIIQRYAYDAYGQMLAPTGYTPAAAALTTLLYSGESFNAATGLQYLRARYYDPNTGRFNRLDPFAGNQNDPQSLHKYLYTHGNPVMGVDPSGEMSITSQTITAGIRATLQSIKVVGLAAAKHVLRNKKTYIELATLATVTYLAYDVHSFKPYVVIVDDGGGLHEIRNVGGDDVANLLHDLKVKNKKIKTLFIAAHADSTVIQLRGDYILQANTSGVWIGDGHNLTDLTHDIRGLLDVGAVIQLAGCNTADGTHNHAYYMSMSFHNVSVMGSSFYTAQIPPTEYFLMNEKTYLNGGIVNTGWGFSGKP